MQLVAEVAAGHRTEFGLRVGWVSGLQRGHSRQGCLDEVFVHRVVDQKALGGNATLAVVEGSGGGGGPRCGRYVGVGENDERIGPTQFEHGRLQRGAGLGADVTPDRLRAGERHGRDAVIVDEGSDSASLDQHGAEQAFG